MTIIQLTTVHPRNDNRIFNKECSTLKYLPFAKLFLVVADGNGSGRWNGLKVIDLGGIGKGRIKRAILGNTTVFMQMRRMNPSIVHFHDPELIPVGLLCKLFGMLVVYDVHESVPSTIMKRKYLPQGMRKAASVFIDRIEKIAGRVFDCIVAATPAIGMRFPRNKTTIIQNFPIKGELLSVSGKAYKNRPFDFVYVGGLTRERAAVEMLNALCRINVKSEVKLHIAGNFRPEELKKKMEKTEGWQYVVFYDWVDRCKMSDILSQARAGLVLFHPTPNHVDSQPNKLFEYMSASLPVIASDFPLWRKIVEGADCGLLVDPQDSDAIAEAMQWILEHPEKAKQMGENGRRAVDEVYNWEAESEKLLVMYKDLINLQQPGVMDKR